MNLRTIIFLVVMTYCALAMSAVAAETNSSLPAAIQRRLEHIRSDLIELRHDLHRHPEVSGQEIRTAGIVAKRLRSLGLTVTTDVGGHGVVGLLPGGKPGVVVAYRADMDAVSAGQEDPAAFPSETPGVRHICGHDVHTTVGVGIAEALFAVRNQLPGAVKFIFQPAEETVQGARAMISAGVLEQPRPAAIFALHTAPFPVGVIGCPTGIALPGRDFAFVRLKGPGDLKAAASALKRVIQRLNTIPAEGLMNLAKSDVSNLPKDFIYPQVVSSSLRGDRWDMEVVVSASSQANYGKAKRAIFEAIRAVKTDHIEAEVDYKDRQLPDTINDGPLVEAAVAAVQGVSGERSVVRLESTVPYFGEDFSFFQKQIPGALLWLGVSNPEQGIVGVPHTPNYQADDAAIEFGARVMANVLLDYLEKNSGLTAETANDFLPDAPPGKEWKLVWHDEFDGARLDESKWNRLGDWKRRDGFWIKDDAFLNGQGQLILRTRQDGDRFTCGAVNTQGKFEHAFGYYVARCKLPSQPGHWPAFWLMSKGVNQVGDDGRDGTEIDIIEIPWRDGRLTSNLHWDGYGKAHKSAGKSFTLPTVTNGFHTFSLLWQPTEYVFYVDGREVWRSAAGGVSQAPEYLKLTEEIGKWGGEIRGARLPDAFEVEYVRVYDLVGRP